MRINDHVVRVGAPGPVRSLPRICVLSLLIVLAAPGARGQVGPWEAHTVSGGVVYAVEARPADLDGDGDVDVVSAALTGDKITVHENVGATGGSWTNHFVASVNGPSGLFPVDLAADGGVSERRPPRENLARKSCDVMILGAASSASLPKAAS